MNNPPLDILALAAHRDDVEQTCGGTLLKMAQRGRRTGILDLTRGEMGTRGSAQERAAEAAEAARILQVAWRQALDIPDGRVENTWENRLKVARVIREQRPRVVILPYWEGRHPDHYTASVLGYEACFLAGLAKLGKTAISHQQSAFSRGPEAQSQESGVAKEGIWSQESGVSRLRAKGADLSARRASRAQSQLSRIPSGTVVEAHGFSRGKPSAAEEEAALAAVAEFPPHRPFKIIYATLYYDIRPTFVVDITEQFEARLQSIYAYKSQFTDQAAGAGDFPAHAEIRERVATMAGFYGLLAGVKYAEPFLQKEVGLVEDLLQISVKSI
ncbi:MAG TPA: PIG-L family deacetylase [Terriglobales bacterium]|nr:PIG-L family deacetylase [Terriglobales bacterium]